MQNIRTVIFQKDLRGFFKDYTIALCLVFMALLLLSSGVITLMSWNIERKQVLNARTNFRDQWEKQHTNPHEAAHYGTYLFKPTNLLVIFDQGLNDFFGSSYRVEAHNQTELEHIKAADNQSLTRFGPLSLALILQLMLPLLLLYISSSAISSEKESGTWKMLLAQGVKPAEIIWQKVGANYILALLISLPVWLFLFALLMFFDTTLLGRFLFLLLCHLVFYLVIVIIGVGVSSLCSRSANAMIGVFCIWLVFFILLPPILTNSADNLNQLMSRATFKNNVEQGFLKGINGNDPYYKRGERNIKQLLARYHAESLSQLPINAAGITLQMNEDYQNMVFEHYYNEVRQKLNKQQDFLSQTSFLSPFLSIKRISETTCGTDFYQHSGFYDQARAYRNNLIRKLNMDLAQHPEKIGSTYIGAPTFFKSIKEFNYHVPDMGQVIAWQYLPVISLLIWLGFLAGLLQFITKWI